MLSDLNLFIIMVVAILVMAIAIALMMYGFSFVSVMELRDGKITRWWDYFNLATLLDAAPPWWLDHIAQGYR